METVIRTSSGSVVKWLIVVLFFGSISIPMLAHIVSFSDPEREHQVRPPEWVGFRRLREFTRATDAYISENFGLPRQLVRWNSLLRHRLGASSTPGVVVGAGGWLFYAGEKILEQHTG